MAILGGGVAGLTTAFEFSRPGWEAQFDSITVYQYGWRLGGKGASGRGVYDRIEEHGLHVWFGFYENAFRMMRECYRELGRAPGEPLATIEDAFERASFFVVEEQRGHDWITWFASFSEEDRLPGEPGARMLPLWAYLLRALRLAQAFLTSAGRQLGSAPLPEVRLAPATDHPPTPIVLAPARSGVVSSVESLVSGLSRILNRAVEISIETALAGALSLASSLGDDVAGHDPADHDRLLGFVETAARWARWRLPVLDRMSDALRRQWYLIDILLACIRGILRHGVLHHPDGLDALDEFDFVEWLIQNGADPESARSGFVTTVVYDLQFAYRDGDPSQPSCSAATALRGMIRLFFGYQGAIAWKMRAGMGDAVFAPLYEVLRKRGVRFEFFHRVEALHLSQDRQRIASIDVSRQVRLAEPGREYQPLVLVGGLPCWPNSPLTDQLADADDLRPEDVESFWSRRPPAEQLVLRDGQDFDIVVLAIPVGAHPYICQELIDDSPAWAAMVANVGTIYTQAFQLWLSTTMEELGCDWPSATTGGYLEPFDTYADMRQLIEQERWPPGAVKGIAYFCNAMPTPPGVPSPDDYELPLRADAQVKANALAFLRNDMPSLWPRGVQRYPTDFKWELLAGPGSAEGPQRFDSQFWRANVNPSDRYVLPLPGTAKHRLFPDASGYQNLYLAGDWTQCGLNAGCVESAVTSGRVAASAIAGWPPLDDIVGYRDL